MNHPHEVPVKADQALQFEVGVGLGVVGAAAGEEVERACLQEIQCYR